MILKLALSSLRKALPREGGQKETCFLVRMMDQRESEDGEREQDADFPVQKRAELCGVVVAKKKVVAELEDGKRVRIAKEAFFPGVGRDRRAFC